MAIAVESGRERTPVLTVPVAPRALPSRARARRAGERAAEAALIALTVALASFLYVCVQHVLHVVPLRFLP